MISFKQFLLESKNIFMPKDNDHMIARHPTLKQYTTPSIITPRGEHQGEFWHDGRQFVMVHVPREKKFVFHAKQTGNPAGIVTYNKNKNNEISNAYMHFNTQLQGTGIGSTVVRHISQRHKIAIDDNKLQVTKGGKTVLDKAKSSGIIKENKLF